MPACHGGCPEDGTGLDSLLALHAEADERARDGAELFGLFLGEVRPLDFLDVAFRVFSDGDEIDQPHDLAVAQPIELGEDLALEFRIFEADHDHLNRPKRHQGLLSVYPGTATLRTLRVTPRHPVGVTPITQAG